MTVSAIVARTLDNRRDAARKELADILQAIPAAQKELEQLAARRDALRAELLELDDVQTYLANRKVP